MNKVILVDAQNAAWRAFHAYSRLSYKGKGVGIIYGLPSMLASLRKEFPEHVLIMIWEGKKSKLRLTINPEYKAHRKSKSLIDYDDFLEQKEICQKLIYFLGIRQMHNIELEGDDLLYAVWNKLHEKKAEEIIIHSSDKDFNQLIGKKESTVTKVYTGNKQMVTEANCKSIFNYTPKECVDYLILTGDDSDNIKGYPGIGPAKARAFLDQWGSIKKFLDSKTQSKIDRYKLSHIYRDNKVLIDLRHFYIKILPDIKNRIQFLYSDPRPEKNPNQFRKLASKFNMQKLMGNSFIEKF